MRIDIAVAALALIVASVTAIAVPSPQIKSAERIPRRRPGSNNNNNNNQHNFVDGNRADAAAKHLLERATPEHKRLPRPPTGVGKNGRIDHDFAFDRKAKANMAVDSDPTFEISYLSKSDDDDNDDAVYEEEQPGGDLRRRNPHEASCYDVPTFALNGILGLFPPDEKCTHVRDGARSVAITCYHSSTDADGTSGGGGIWGRKAKRSADEMHEERRLNFLSVCDTNTRAELLMS
ncbi:hypothetical protein MN608_04145 [Microdochium nivale]|nr:hypothetical protein MN608_04145 [Microdochium nivale]